MFAHSKYAAGASATSISSKNSAKSPAARKNCGIKSRQKALILFGSRKTIIPEVYYMVNEG